MNQSIELLLGYGGMKMNILVCIKQVPDTTEIKIDPVTNTLIRAGVPSIVNPFDAYALEIALRIKDAAGARVVVATMGPDQAKNALKECLSMGADQAYIISGREFGGSDTLATSYIISCSVAAIEEREGAKFDLIFCGKQAIDGDTAQVGPELAEHLGYPQITYAVEASYADDEITVKREVDDGYEIVASKLPCVVTVTKPKFDPRYPTIKGKLAANRAVIPAIGPTDITIDLTRAGLKGSPTKVKKTFTPSVKQGGVVISEGSASASAKRLAELLTEAGTI